MEEKCNKYLKDFKLSDNKEFMGIPSNEDFEIIKSFVSNDTIPSDLFVYKIKLCDNEIDRDFEQFSSECLDDLASLFYSKPGVFNHDWNSEGIHSRLYKVIPVTVEDSFNSQGEPYKYLEGYAYTVKENQDLINFIKRGLKREVSVGVKGSDLICSVCGDAIHQCNHIKGQVYDGKLCYGIIPHAEDAYEFSFVAVNSQKDANVQKNYTEGGSEMNLQEVLQKIEKICPNESLIISKAFKELGEKEDEMVKLREDITRLTSENEELKGCVEKFKAEELEREHAQYLADALYGLEIISPKAEEIVNMIIEGNKDLTAAEVHNLLEEDYPFLFNLPVKEDEKEEKVEEIEKVEKVENDKEKKEDKEKLEEIEEEIKDEDIEKEEEKEKIEIEDNKELKEIVDKKLKAFKAGKLNIRAIQEKMLNENTTTTKSVSGMKFN